MRFKLPAGFDPFLLALVSVVTTASLLPCRGTAAVAFDDLTVAAIALLFFLHGAKLSREAIVAGIGHWRLHGLVLASTFVLFPILGLGVRAIGHGWINPSVSAGLLFLCLLPSTVQSSIAFTSIAGGNVPAAVCSASASNFIGIFLTPVLVGLLMGARAGGGASLHSVEAIALQLLAPFVLGHLSRPLTARFLGAHKKVVNLVDRGSILMVVYGAFSEAVSRGLWNQLPLESLAVMAVLNFVLLGIVLGLTDRFGRAVGFNAEDRITLIFCGSKKSLASGVPMANILFPAAMVGPVVLPLMLFHQIQLMACAYLARRFAGRAAPAEAADERHPPLAA